MGVVAALLLAALLAAPAAGAATLTLRVTSVALSVKPNDLPPKGTSKGDTIAYRDRLLNARAQFGRRKGAVVGSDRGTMTFTGRHDARFAGLARLPGGTVRLVGKVTALPNRSLVIPVAGGTGRFAGAHGYVLVAPGTRTSLNTYTITLPTVPVA
jgi:dirigent-like protein